MNTVELVLYSVAAVLFLVAAVAPPSVPKLARFDLVALGLAFWVTVEVIEQFQTVRG